MVDVKKSVLRASLGIAATPSWVPRRADGSPVTAFADYVNDHYFFLGRVYLTEIAFNVAVNLSKSGAVRSTISPYVIGSELIPNGDFSSNDISAWLFDTNNVLTWQSPGKLRNTNNTGATAAVRAYLPITVSYPHTYRFSYNAVNGLNRTLGFANGSNVQTVSFTPVNLGPGTFNIYGKPSDSGTVVSRIFLRADNCPNGSFAEWDDLSLKEVVPMQGWGDGTSFSGFVTGTAGTSDPTGNEVIFQTDNGTENDRMRIVRDATKTLRLITTRASGQQANLSLNALNNGADFSASFTVAHNDVRGARDGGTPATTSSASFPGTAFLRAGGATVAANENWPASAVLKTWCIQ